MDSKYLLKQLCPCGSGQAFHDCCARADESAAPRPREDPDAHLLDEIEQFHYQFNGFYRAFTDVYKICMRYERGRGAGGSDRLISEALEYLETRPERTTLSAGTNLLLWTYAIFGLPIDATHRDERADYVESAAGPAGRDALDKIESASFGVWEATDSPAHPTALRLSRIDGRHPSQHAHALAAVDHKLEQVDPGVYIGWKLDFGDQTALFCCAAVGREMLAKLESAARRAAWGNGAHFRSQDYQDDMIALLLRPSSIDTGRQLGRIFLHEGIERHWSIRPSVLCDKVVEWIDIAGLDTSVDSASDLLSKLNNDWGYTPESHASSWSVTAARAVGEKFDRLVELLRGYRDANVSSYARQLVPVGEHSLEYLLPIEAMLSIISLTADGGVDHPTVHGALNFPMAVLDIDPAGFRAVGFDLSWTIQQGLVWGAEHAPDAIMEALDEAVAAHQTACRWVGIVARSEDAHAPERALSVRYDGLIEGLTELLPDQTARLPLSAFEDPGRDTWKRISSAMRAAGELGVNEELTVGGLPDELHDLSQLEGIGGVSVDHLRTALATYVAEWPASAGHLSAASNQKHADEAAGELSSGLDALEALF